MTAEALRDYLVGRGFTEDVAQDVIVSYLTTKSKVRDPQAWSVKAALHLTSRYAHGPSPTGSRVDHQQSILPTQDLVGREPDALRIAIAQQELATIFAQPTPRVTYNHRRSSLWGYRVKGFKRCQEDYAVYIGMTRCVLPTIPPTSNTPKS